MAKPTLVLSLIYTLAFIYPVYHYPTPSALKSFCTWTNHIVWGIFVADYLVMFYLAPRKKKFFRAHIFELILVALPFVRMLRPLRAIMFIGQAGFRSRRQLIKNLWWVVLLASFLMIIIMGAAILDIERTVPNSNIKTPSDAVWWAFVTITTVGYGDKFPISTEGRLVAGFLILFGVLMMATITGAAAAWILEQQIDDDIEN
jgi:voltage-gated potassium channel